MERSDEARREDSLYDRMDSLQQENRRLETKNQQLRGSFEQEAIRLLNIIKQLKDKIETLKQSCRSYEIIVRQKLDRIKGLEVVIKNQDDTIDRQGKEALRRHDFLCKIKEIVDSYFGE